MAQHMLTPPPLEFVDRRRTSSVGNAAISVGTLANYASNAALDARLAAISATTFTAARLELMTQNDKIYALRTLDDNASI